MKNTQAYLEENFISKNQASKGGGVMGDKNGVTLQKTTFDSNPATYGAGLYASQLAVFKFELNTCKSNAATNKGGAIWAFSLSNLRNISGTSFLTTSMNTY